MIRIVIADDHAIVRAGLRALVEAQPGLAVVGEAEDGEEAWRQACNLKPDVLLLDLSMPRVDGAEATERIMRDCPEVRILVLTMHEERSYVVRLFALGASGYLLKRTAAQELVRAIRTVAGGKRYVDPSVATTVPPGGTQPAVNGNGRGQAYVAVETPGDVAALSESEREVLRRIAEGRTNGEIASALGLGIAEVGAHKAEGMRKLGLTSRAAVVRFAAERGWGGA